LRLKSALEIRELRQAMATEERPEIYARLAELYRYLGQFEEALAVAREGMELFPESAGNYLAVGRIHYTRFLKTASARDGRAATDYLLRAYELDQQNFKTLFHLANLYLTAGDRPHARVYLEMLARLVPGDSRIGELWERLHALPDAADDPRADHFARYEASMRGAAERGRPASAFRVPPDVVVQKVKALLDLRGIQAVQLLDGGGRAVVAAGAVTDAQAAEEAVRALFDGARLNAPRMSIGTFSQGVLTCRTMKIWLYDIDGFGLALFGDATAREDLVHRRVASVIAECFCEATAP
jgi:tetratricopeptide (TPR) repeat protein